MKFQISAGSLTSQKKDIYFNEVYKYLARGTPLKYSADAMVTLVEFENFTRFASKNLTLDEVDALKEFLAMAPEEGAVIQGTGGLRKLRWAKQGRGQSGGVRVIYYYHNQGMPLLLLDGFAKNEMENISQAARNAYKKLIPVMVQHYLSRTKK